MEYLAEEKMFVRECRCSGRYEITEDQLEVGYDTVCCSSCSLYVRVLYEIVDEEPP